MSRKVLDFCTVVTLMILSAGAWLYFDLPPLLGGGILYVFLPTLYLCWREKKNYRKILLGTFIFGIVLGFIFDSIEVFNHAWSVHHLVFPLLLFGFDPIDDILGFGFMTAFMLVFYEHFLDDEKHRRISIRAKKLLVFTLIAACALSLIFVFGGQAIHFGRPYFWGGIFAIFFPAVFIALHRDLIAKFSQIAIFFLFVYFLAEYVAVASGGWTYGTPNMYIGWITFLNVSFPIEELIFWMLWYAAATVAYYEYFIDDGK